MLETELMGCVDGLRRLETVGKVIADHDVQLGNGRPVQLVVHGLEPKHGAGVCQGVCAILPCLGHSNPISIQSGFNSTSYSLTLCHSGSLSHISMHRFGIEFIESPMQPWFGGSP